MDCDKWEELLSEEARFWRHRLQKVDDAIRERLAVHKRHISRTITDTLPPDLDGPIRILDAGSGPLTTIATHWPGKEVELFATDVLGDEYRQILTELGIEAPYPPAQCGFEELPKRFPNDYFDFANAANCLDHCADPISAVRAIVAVLKPGRVLRLHHHYDVGEMQRYRGLHQWNLNHEEGDVVVWNKAGKRFLSQELPEIDVSGVYEMGDTFAANLKKAGASNSSPLNGRC